MWSWQYYYKYTTIIADCIMNRYNIFDGFRGIILICPFSLLFRVRRYDLYLHIEFYYIALLYWLLYIIIMEWNDCIAHVVMTTRRVRCILCRQQQFKAPWGLHLYVSVHYIIFFFTMHDNWLSSNSGSRYLPRLYYVYYSCLWIYFSLI